jgi:hypothetical protein
MESEWSFFCCKVQFFTANSYSHRKRINFLLDAVAASDSLCLFTRMCFSISFLPPRVTEKTLLHNVHLTLITSVSPLIRNGYSRLRTSENKHFLLRGAISSKFKPLLIMHTIKQFTMRILYCLFTIKPSTSPYINRLTLTLHITTRYRIQYETNTPIKTNSNKDYTGSGKKSKNKNSLFALCQ